MRIEQRRWTRTHGWTLQTPEALGGPAQLILLFGARAVLKDQRLIEQVAHLHPGAHILGCSTAGEIGGTEVWDDSLVATAAQFEHSYLRGSQIRLGQVRNSFHAGESLANALDPTDLIHVLVLSDGLTVNGSDLVRGLMKYLPASVTVTGGLAGDGDRFEETVVFWDKTPEKDTIAALGFYGSRLKVGCGSLGGWDPFGPERLITHSKGNVLYEFDGKSALELYKMYLGEHAKGLPAAGLLFPLSLRTRSGETGVVRTILSIDEKDHSMTFAGDVPEGSYARLMKANFDRLIDGATGAARLTQQASGAASPDLAILISCVGRKLVLKQRIEEEVEAVRDILGDRTILTGFYSYGEIAPVSSGEKCELHNQTMTITTFSEE
ncbi:MAG TPA: FIST C-terminal domain-containing protein [Syntrophobacteraceae bacterium]|nr:FIST C-terminal domain-containing protein [Syntrophobacteraceae bacterium]